MALRNSIPKLSGRGWSALQKKAVPNSNFRREARNQDGWANLLTGAGIQNIDKTLSTDFLADVRLDYQLLTQIYRSFGLGRKIIDIQTTDMYRAGFKIEGDTDGVIHRKLKVLEAIPKLRKATTWGYLYGGALAVVGLNDGGEYWEPLNENNIKSIEHIHVFDKWRVTLNTTDLYIDPNMDKYGKPEFYNIVPIYGTPFRVHESRVLRFEGKDIADQVRIQNQGWGDSYLQSLFSDLKNLGSAYTDIATIISEFILGVLTIDNLMNLLANGQEDLIRKRLMEMDLSKSNLSTTLLDKEEKYERLSATTTGLSDLMNVLVEAVSASSDIPICKLMGRSQAGLSDSENAQVGFYNDKIYGQQEIDVIPQLTQLVSWINIAEGNLLREEWDVKANPLKQPTAKEEADLRKVNADAAVELITAGVLYPEEVAQSMFGGDHYSSDIILSDAHKKELEAFKEQVDKTQKDLDATKKAQGKKATNSFDKVYGKESDNMGYMGSLKPTDLKNMSRVFLPKKLPSKGIAP